MSILRVLISAAILLALLPGCASLPDDRGLGDVRRLVTDRSKQELPSANADAPKIVSELLADRLTASAAVALALINNPRLRAEYARLRISAAEVYDAGRLSNPRLGISVMASDEHGTANQVTFGLAQSFTDLLLLSARGRIAEADFERTKLEVGAAIIDFSADTEEAYFRLVGAQQVTAMRKNLDRAAQASAGYWHPKGTVAYEASADHLRRDGIKVADQKPAMPKSGGGHQHG